MIQAVGNASKSDGIVQSEDLQINCRICSMTKSNKRTKTATAREKNWNYQYIHTQRRANVRIRTKRIGCYGNTNTKCTVVMSLKCLGNVNTNTGRKKKKNGNKCLTQIKVATGS